MAQKIKIPASGLCTKIGMSQLRKIGQTGLATEGRILNGLSGPRPVWDGVLSESPALPGKKDQPCPGESAVGKLIVTIGVGDQQGRQFEDIEVTVDTGSTFTAVPRTLLQNLGVPVGRSARSRLADGSTAPVDIGWTMIRLEGQTFPTPVIFAAENQPSLLGVVALEEALLAVDPVGQQLVPVDVMRL